VTLQSIRPPLARRHIACVARRQTRSEYR